MPAYQTQNDDYSAASRVCVLVTLNDLERLYAVKHALEARGIEVLVSGGPASRLLNMASSTPRLLVRERDLVYARWVAHAAGVDALPDDEAFDPCRLIAVRPDRPNGGWRSDCRAAHTAEHKERGGPEARPVRERLLAVTRLRC